jgi:hypothetical protein
MVSSSQCVAGGAVLQHGTPPRAGSLPLLPPQLCHSPVEHAPSELWRPHQRPGTERTRKYPFKRTFALQCQDVVLDSNTEIFGSVSNVEMVAPMTLTYKVLFPSISTIETLPRLVL